MPDSIEEKQQEQLEEAFDKMVKDEDAGLPPEEDLPYAGFTSPLGVMLNDLFSEYERDRRLTEERWIKDLRQIRAEYDPETRKKLHPKRSKANLSITRTKVKTVSSRMADLLFPANSEKNWGIRKSPIPDLNPEVIADIASQFEEATGQQASPEMIKEMINEEANRRSEAMENEIEDQLTELKYRQIIRSVISDGNSYGTGILKGPLGKTVKSQRWLPNEDEWVPINLSKMLPYCEHVSVWDCYPDMSAKNPDDLLGFFQRYVMTRHKVLALAERDDFNGKAIRAYLSTHREGDAEYKPHEQDLKTLNDVGSEQDTAVTARKGRYELREFYGYLPLDKLIDAGLEITDEERETLDIEVAANVWLLGPMVIKAALSPVEGSAIPYHFYYYEKDVTSIWGEGIPTIMRDAQKLFNASVRAMVDNAAISAGPIIEANTDLLEPGEDPKDLFPFRVYKRDGMGQDAASPAIRVYSLPSYTTEFMQMIEFFMNAADEVTAIPRYMYGDTSNVGGAGKTATGLSMLMGAANTTLKEQVKNFDDGITIPYIKAHYAFNMEWSEKEHIKGDYNVVARGSTSMIAREVQTEALMQFMNITNNEVDLAYTKRDSILRELVKVLDLDELDLIKDPNTVKIESEQRAQAEKEEMAFQRELEMMKADSGGHTTEGKSKGARPDMEQLQANELESGQLPEVMDGEGTLLNG